MLGEQWSIYTFFMALPILFHRQLESGGPGELLMYMYVATSPHVVSHQQYNQYKEADPSIHTKVTEEEDIKTHPHHGYPGD